MAKPGKAVLKRGYFGTSRSWHPWNTPHTTTSANLISRYEKVLFGPSVNSNGRTPTALYRERFVAHSGYLNRRTQVHRVWYQKNEYAFATDTGNLYSSYSVYNTTSIPGFSPKYNYLNDQSLTGYNSETLRRLDDQILKKLGKASLDIGVILIEMKETVNWISKRSGQLIDGLISAQQGKVPKMGRILGFNPKKLKNWNIFRKMGRNPAADLVSQLILETNFAIKPLLKDIEDGVNLFRDPKHNVFYGNVRAAHDESKTYRKQNWNGTVNYNEQVEVDLHRKNMVFTIRDPDLIARKALGLTTNPASAWEGVPYSWLIDYALGIGQFLADTVATQGLSMEGGSRSRKLKLLTHVSMAYDYTNGSNIRAGCKYTAELYRRDLEWLFPSASLNGTFDELTFTKATNVLALAQQLRRS